jgi:hypothetical protein
MDASLRPLQERIYALTDEKAAAQQAAEAIAKAQEQSARIWTDYGNALADTMKKAKEAAAALRDYGSTLLLGQSSTLGNSAKVEVAKTRFETADAASLKDASSAYLEALKASAGQGSLEYAKGFAAVQERLAKIAAQQDAYAGSIPAFWKLLLAQNSVNGSHANGLDSVPFDGYRANLHRGEKVLTSAEASDYRGGAKAVQENNRLLERLITVVESGNGDAKTVARILQNSSPDGQRLKVVIA